LEDFGKMTLRQLSGCLEMIEIRTHNDFALDANIHGHKVEMKKVQKVFEEMNDEQARMMAEVHRQAIKRKFEEKNKEIRE
jgi:hypothetical protein